jgi:clan AA aspartic protease
MMTGIVEASLQPLIRVTVRDVVGREQEVEALIDTGFTGSLTLPAPVVSVFGLLWLMRQRGRLAGAVSIFLDVHRGTVLWDGQWRTIEIEAVDGIPLVGTELLRGYELRIQAVVGGLVTIEAIP